jgi:hypothetical protein
VAKNLEDPTEGWTRRTKLNVLRRSGVLQKPKRSKGVAQKVVPETENQLDTKRSGSEGSLNWYEDRYGDLSREGLEAVHR